MCSSAGLDSSLNLREIFVTDLSCGSIRNFGGGLVLKLQLTSSTIRCVALTPEPTFSLKDAFDAQAEPPLPKHLELQLQSECSKDHHAPLEISEHDYQSLKKTSIAVTLNIYTFTGVTIVCFHFHSGFAETYAFNASAWRKLGLLLREHETFGNLVDTRTIKKMTPDEIEAHLTSLPGYRLNNLLAGILRSKNIVDKNHRELDNHLQQFDGPVEDPDFTNWTLRHRKALYLEELFRLLHNFLASCGSLIDHHRIIVNMIEKEYRNIPNYNSEKEKRFVNDPLVQFIKDFRNFLLHYGLPSASMRSQLSAEGVSGTVLLVRKDLLRWKGWNSKAKEFLCSQGTELNLRRVTSSYFEKLSSFYKWFESEYSRTFWKELNEWNIKQQAICLDRGVELNQKLRQELSSSKVQSSNTLLNLLSDRCSPEELHELHKLLDSPQALVTLAVDLTVRRFPLPADIEKKLLETANSIEATRNSKFKNST